MKKYLAMLCATMMCVCCLGLVACGGGSSSSAAASGSASASASASSASASASSASAEADFVGTWKLAALESQGVIMTGDLSAMIGDETGFALDIKADGTGSMSVGAEAVEMTWVKKDANTITVTPVQSASASAESASASAESASAESAVPTTMDIVYEEGNLTLEMSDETMTGTLWFSKDGTYEDAMNISIADSKPITSMDALVGTWRLSGINMMGVNMYGTADALSAIAGGADTSLTIASDGKVTMSGQETEVTIDATGASIASGGMSLPIVDFHGDIIVDMSGVLGMEMMMLFTK